MLLLQEQARHVITLSEVEPRVQEQGRHYEGAKGSLQGAIAAVVSELLSQDKYTHAGEALTLIVTVSPAHGDYQPSYSAFSTNCPSL